MRGELKISIVMLLAGMALLCASTSQAEVILQYFNTDYQELMHKLPELVEVGYEAIWLPPPTKASGGLSTGYDCWDPFDLGSKNQSGSVRTKYGTDGQLRELIRADDEACSQDMTVVNAQVACRDRHVEGLR